MDRSVEVRLRLEISNYMRNASTAGRETDALTARMAALDAQVDHLQRTSQSTATALRDQRAQVRGLGRDTERTGGQLAGAQARLDAWNASTARGQSGVAGFRREVAAGGRDIDRFSGRLGLALDGILTLGPGLVPLGAVAGQALGGISTALAAIVTTGASAMIAMQGVGDAVKAVDAYQADKTAANLEKAQEAMSELGPDARRFVVEFQKAQPLFTEIRDAAAAGWFPGLTAALGNLDELAPKLAHIVEETGRAGGGIVEDATSSLAGERWDDFFDFIAVELPRATQSLSRTMGDIAHGAAEMWMAMDPGNDRFLSWLEDVGQGFDDWASSAEGREDIESFLAYARDNGPEVAALFSSLVGALSAITRAAAPLGGPTLEALTMVSDVIGTIADSDMGTPIMAAVIALRLFKRAADLAATAQARLSASNITGGSGPAPTPYIGAHTQPWVAAAVAARQAQQLRQERMVAAAKGAALVAGIGLVASGATDELGMTNTAMLTIAGTAAGPYGAAAGAVVGTLLDIRANAKQTQDTLNQFNDVLASGSTNLADYAAAAGALATTRDDYLSNFDSVGSTVGFLGTNPAETYNLLGDALDGNIDRLGAYSDAASKADSMTDQIGRNFMLVAQQLGNTTPITASDLMDPDVDRVQGIIDGLTPSLDRMGLTLEDVGNMTPTELSAFAGDLAAMNGQLFESNNLLKGFTDSLAAAQGFLDDRSAMRNYEAAIDAATEALKKNGKVLDVNRPKGRENAASLDAIATAGLQMAERLEGVDQREFLRGLRKQIRETAESFGMPKKAIDNLLDQLNLLDRQKPKPKVDLDDDSFFSRIAAARAALANLSGDRADTYIYTHHIQVNETRNAAMVAEGSAGTGRTPRTVAPRTSPRGVLSTPAGKTLINLPGAPLDYKLGGNDFHARSTRDQGIDFGAIHTFALELGDIDFGSIHEFAIEVDDAAGGIKSWKKQLHEAEKALQRETARRDAARSLRDEVGGSLSVGELFGNGLAGFDTALAANTNDTQAGNAALAQAQANGLNGPLYQLLAGSGDLTTLQQFAGLTPAQIRRRERQYAALTASQGRLGDAAVFEKYGESIAHMNRDIREMTREVKRLDKAVEKGAERGTRRGSRAGTEAGAHAGTASGQRVRDRNLSSRVRAGR